LPASLFAGRPGLGSRNPTELMAALKTLTLPVTEAGTVAQFRNLSSTKTAVSLATFSQSCASIRSRTCSQSSGSTVAAAKGAVARAWRSSCQRRASMIEQRTAWPSGILPVRLGLPSPPGRSDRGAIAAKLSQAPSAGRSA